LEVHTSLLTSGSTKNSIMEAILWSVEGQDLLSSSVTLDLQVKNIGTMLEPTGYAKANRHLMIEFNKLVPVRFLPHHSERVSVPLDPDTKAAVSRLYHTTLSDGHTTVLFNYPGEHFFRDHHYTIGFTMYELSGIPSWWVEKCNQMDEIWVPSSFNQQTFTTSGVDQNKLRVMPLGVNPLTFSPDAIPLTIRKQRYTFLSVISGFSSGFSDRRKGIDVLLPAFLEELSESEDVCLVIKTHATSEDEVRNQQAFIDRLSHEITGKTRDSIVLISSCQPWTEEEMGRLYRAADCYVFPTRGEGWNMTVMEAMATGIPVITTNWSAHLDFMNDSNEILFGKLNLLKYGLLD
jgi:glycosyltransferase involved in cell wall biosynthesis